jgi:hypothetical protein
MTAFTYHPPDAKTFLNTLRLTLEASGKPAIAALLVGAGCELYSSQQFSHVRWDGYDAELRIRVPVDRLAKFTESIKKELLALAKQNLPGEVGYDFSAVVVSPFLEAPVDDETPIPNATLVKGAATIEHDGLHFRSKTETKIYDALKKRNVLLLANATAVLGGKPDDAGRPNTNKREPDFLVCQDGKWGVFEVMGEPYHPASTAMRDHDRARLLDDYGIRCIHFYDSSRCYSDPEGTVDDFLKRLAKS